jgi:hypothetical protein
MVTSPGLPIDAVASNAKVVNGAIEMEFEGSGRLLRGFAAGSEATPEGFFLMLQIEGVKRDYCIKRWVTLLPFPGDDRVFDDNPASLDEARLSAGDCRILGEALLECADEMEALEWAD